MMERKLLLIILIRPQNKKTPIGINKLRTKGFFIKPFYTQIIKRAKVDKITKPNRILSFINLLENV